MKKGIHPEYHRCTVTCINCGSTFETGSTLKEIRVDSCSKCNSFFTGKTGTVISDGRIDRFNKKYGIGNDGNVKIAEPAKEDAAVKAETK